MPFAVLLIAPMAWSSAIVGVAVPGSDQTSLPRLALLFLVGTCYKNADL